MRKEELEKQAAREGNHWWFVVRRDLLAHGFTRGACGEHPEILEIGAASGGNEPVCRRFGRYTAFDLSDSALDICRSRGIERLVRGDAESLPFAANSFDFVVAFDIFEHLQGDEVSMWEIARVLRPGGVLLANVPAFQKLFSGHDVSFDHIRRYQPGEFDTKLRKAGFETLFRSYWSFFIFPAVYLVRTLAGRPSEGQEAKSDFDRPLPAIVTWTMSALANLELFLMRRGVSFPFGVSYCCFARKPMTTPGPR